MNEKDPRNSVEVRQSARWLTADTETPISLFMSIIGRRDGILLESAEVDGRWGRYSLLGCDMALLIRCREGRLDLEIHDSRFDALHEVNGMPFLEGLREILKRLIILPPQGMDDLPAATRALYGYIGFGMASIFNPHLASAMPPEEARCELVLPRTLLVFDHPYNRLCQITLGDRHEDISALRLPVEVQESGLEEEQEVLAEPDEAGYMETVMRIRDLLRRGEAIQVVPSVRFSTPFSDDPFALYRRMRSHNASPYMFYMRFPDITLFGSSPEVMVRCKDRLLELSPIAGTRRRGRDDAEDEALARELLQDPKERAEHVMLVDLGRNDLGRVAAPGSVRVDRYMEVERFSHVMHLTSRISARLAQGGESERPLDALDVLAAAFPAGTVAGAPKIRAMELIRTLEKAPRGPYAGCVGWIGLDHNSVNLDMGITIRSMWLEDGILSWQAGGGIVHDSDPRLEWKEVCNKSAIMRLALQGEGNHVSAHR